MRDTNLLSPYWLDEACQSNRVTKLSGKTRNGKLVFTNTLSRREPPIIKKGPF